VPSCTPLHLVSLRDLLAPATAAITYEISNLTFFVRGRASYTQETHVRFLSGSSRLWVREKTASAELMYRNPTSHQRATDWFEMG
jgi:hypothetical protein